MQTEPLALVETDELRDVGRRDADAPLVIQSDGVLILKGDEWIVGDRRLRHVIVPQHLVGEQQSHGPQGARPSSRSHTGRGDQRAGCGFWVT